MIPLRILHAVSSPDSDEAQAARPVLDDLAKLGHDSAWLCPGSHPERAADGRTIISFASGSPLGGHGWHWWRWWRSERTATVRRIATWAPDLIHVDALTQLATAIDVGRRLGLSLITTLQQGEEPYAARRLRDPLVTWVLVPSEHHRAEMVGRLGVARDRIAILPTGVAVTAVAADGTDSGPWIAGVVAGHDVPALKLWLRALAEVQEAGLPVQGRILVGTPAQQVRLQELAGETGATVTVQLGGNLIAFIAGLDVLVLPSTREAPAVYALTAMANGKPLLALTTGGLPELVRDGRTALLIEPGNRDGLADGLRQLHDRTLRRTMGEAARTMAAERYAAPLVAEAMLAVYRAALGDPGSGAKAEVTTAWRRMTESRSR